MTLSRAPITTALLATIAAVFAMEFATGDALIARGAVVSGMLARGEYWRIVTAMFLHHGFIHWAVNSWALYQLGVLYEAMFGSGRFAFIYFVSGACASIASSLTIRGASVGASGAIFGILGAFIFSIRRSPQWRHEPWTRGLLSQLTFWAIVNIALGFTVAYIDNVAHITGLVTGLLLGFMPHRVPPPPPSRSVIDVKPFDEGSSGPSEDQR